MSRPARPRRFLALVALSAAALLLGCWTLLHALAGGGIDGPYRATIAHSPATSTAAPDNHPAALPASKPVRVRIPSAGVDTGPVLPLGLAPDGTVQVPTTAQADDIGWYTGGVTPGQTGPAVLIGHFDTVDGPAVMCNVSRVRVGDPITVSRADGSVLTFTVQRLQQVDKAHFPTRAVYGNTDRPELRLITCGGPITDGHHPDNIIIYADLTSTRT
ncbi:class F sortase [Streptantibioticus cattleyicolor]|uniref:Peptidase C60, sortase A and B n=1 Tax=Streptantibioticus cattleyicolor (strain ATCC 35852 / DSM 46488 / JCM 4925 / NBRC 14057 / NRRL 8057) TaxID=1003195 RepID=F8JKI7_STREN|nr:class F sortase [Streptantibioticus cattleyicolor]AEW99743.1 peptidase C60, sortase A and B [Streptantibioticus cattleyicolor NRRL 8057 = DSM 46488]CCB71216.1 Peptidase C60 sortase A and B [Streptantibioticus cattleyicolor NRRL 8057 = DSM 46488]